jgi:hypothetical protein
MLHIFQLILLCSYLLTTCTYLCSVHECVHPRLLLQLINKCGGEYKRAREVYILLG